MREEGGGELGELGEGLGFDVTGGVCELDVGLLLKIHVAEGMRGEKPAKIALFSRQIPYRLNNKPQVIVSKDDT